jgi:predicted house-cleaning noncanonical NTP pyrophosphatase (MazG superfamily)
VTGIPKLVRDKIPDVIRASGAEPITTIAGEAEYARLLRDKLAEEVAEFLDSDDPGELADVVEVVLALAATLGVDRDGLEALRAAKQAERGGFERRIVWLGSR